MEDSYQEELPKCTSFDSWAGINVLLGCGKGAGMEMTQGANGSFPTEDAI